MLGLQARSVLQSVPNLADNAFRTAYPFANLPKEATVLQLSSAVLLMTLVLDAAAQQPAGPSIAEPKKNDHGFLCHTVQCEFQAGRTEIQVLLPERLEKDKRYPVVYVLPVEAGTESRFGNGLLEVKKLELHNKHGLIFVQPTFAQLPWYADHATKLTIRQESYFLKVVVPFVEKQYPARAEASGRLLLGFSKSGWGAFSLLLRNPEMFGKAAAWDAPFTMERPNYGMDAIVGTPENFEKYRIVKLLELRAADLKKEKRLALIGTNAFPEHHQAIHEQMERLKIPHEYRDEKKPKHTWDAGWIEDAVRFLYPEPNR
jgi:Putative esterase